MCATLVDIAIATRALGGEVLRIERRVGVHVSGLLWSATRGRIAGWSYTLLNPWGTTLSLVCQRSPPTVSASRDLASHPVLVRRFLLESLPRLNAQLLFHQAFNAHLGVELCLAIESLRGQREDALIGFRGLMLQALFEKHNSFLRPLKKKGFKEERVTTIGLYDIGKSHDPGIQQEPRSNCTCRAGKRSS